jgi:hypothetical protein
MHSLASKEDATTEQALHLTELVAIHDGHFETLPYSSEDFQASLKVHEMFKDDSKIPRRKGEIFEPLLPLFQKS